MTVIKLTLSGWPIERQTPEESAIWKDCRFLINSDEEDCDYWFVYDIHTTETAVCPPENVVLITGEPPSVHRYPRFYTNQFGTVITCQRELNHPNKIYTQQALPWHVGRQQKEHHNIAFSKNYDELSAQKKIPKENLISVVSSSKAVTAGHKKRLAFVSALKDHFSDQIDVFGRGIREVEDKWDALAPYKYHIAIENCAYPDYWTEKLSDTFLAGCYPLYFGCPNINEYFSPDCYTQINIEDIEGSIKKIEQCISIHTYENSIDSIWSARNDVLNKYNLFELIYQYVKKGYSVHNNSVKHVSIKPESDFLHNRIKSGIKSCIKPFIK